MKPTKRYSFDAIDSAPSIPAEKPSIKGCGSLDINSSKIRETLHRLRKHRWTFDNSVFFTAQPICRPNKTRPAIICLNVWHCMDLLDAEQRALFFRCEDVVLDEIRAMFSGVCGVEFIVKPYGTPFHVAHFLEDIPRVLENQK